MMMTRLSLATHHTVVHELDAAAFEKEIVGILWSTLVTGRSIRYLELWQLMTASSMNIFSFADDFLLSRFLVFFPVDFHLDPFLPFPLAAVINCGLG